LESFSFYITQLIRKYMDANGHEKLFNITQDTIFLSLTAWNLY
jgi:hypothetical protein